MNSEDYYEGIKMRAEEDYAYFDALPQEIRHFIANSAFLFDSPAVWKLFRQRGAYATLIDLKEWEQRMLEELKKKPRP